MIYYKLGEAVTAEVLEKFKSQVPGQAQGILQAIWDIATNTRPVSEDEIHDLIAGDLKKYSPRAKDTSVVEGFIGYYRLMFDKLPDDLIVMSKDNVGAKARAGRKSGGGAETITNPLTGEQIANVFKRAKTLNPGSRGKKKTTTVVTEEILGTDDEDFNDDAPEDEIEGDEDEATSN